MRPDESSQRAFVEAVNRAVQSIGIELREVETDGGFPVFRFTETRKRAGAAKNLIFASQVKPDLRFLDAINNDIEIVSSADKVLVYDRPIQRQGLRWKDLQTWWQEQNSLTPEQAKQTLYRRLEASLPVDSPPQTLLFTTYFKHFGKRIPGLPALLPEVWLHWDPKTVRERGPEALTRFRMDFLMLLPGEIRIVLEVDGKHHYSNDSGKADSARYAEMVRADRDLQLCGYDVYRFGAKELVDAEGAECVGAFFDRLFSRHGVSAE